MTAFPPPEPPQSPEGRRDEDVAGGLGVVTLFVMLAAGAWHRDLWLAFLAAPAAITASVVSSVVFAFIRGMRR